MRYWIFLLAAYTWCSSQVRAEHIAKFELSEIEWNGEVKTHRNPVKVEKQFIRFSDVFVLDTVGSTILFGQFEFMPVFNDTAERPGFRFVVFDSSHRIFDIVAATDYKPGTYDAGMKVRDQHGLRRWAGKLRYVPDTAVHLPRPVWRQDHFTLQIETFQAWNAEVEVKNSSQKKILKRLYFDGYTGNKTSMQSGGRYGDENYFLFLDPVRYQWGSEVWTEITVRLHKKQADGRYVEILAHTFSSKDKGVLYNGAIKNNAYEIRDARNKYYMLITGVLLIPY